LFPQVATPVAEIITTKLDDWGVLIRVTPETIASVASAVGVPVATGPVVATTLPTTVAKVETTKEADEKRIKRAKHAKSMAEMGGIAYAAGDVWLARRITSAAGKEPVKPNPTQVNDLADVTKDMITEWFGDRDIKPWQMMLLLSFGIPIAMLLQSPKAKPKADETKQDSPLKSVR